MVMAWYGMVFTTWKSLLPTFGHYNEAILIALHHEMKVACYVASITMIHTCHPRHQSIPYVTMDYVVWLVTHSLQHYAQPRNKIENSETINRAGWLNEDLYWPTLYNYRLCIADTVDLSPLIIRANNYLTSIVPLLSMVWTGKAWQSTEWWIC